MNIKNAQEMQQVKTNNTILISGYALTMQIKLLKKVGVKGSTEISNFTDLKTKTMTEQEAFNDPEMKTILLLSGYVRELGEGKDYEETTFKTAETLVKVFSIHHVSQQRELLKWMSEQELYKQTPEEIEVLLLAYNFETL